MWKGFAKVFVKDYQNINKPSVRTSYGVMAGWVGIACNLLLFVAKGVAFLFSGSIAIMADAINNLSDAAASIATILGFKLGGKPADSEHPFGHARMEYLAALGVAVMVLIAGVELGRVSIGKMFNPTKVEFSWVVVVILIATILIKFLMAIFYNGIAKHIDSDTLRAASIDSRNDVLATSVVLVGMIIAHYANINLDAYLGIAVAAFILFSGIQLAKDTLSPILGQAPDPKMMKSLDTKIKKYSGVLGTHDLIVHDYGPGRRFASAHVEMDSSQDVLVSHDTIDRIERDVLEQDNIHLIIHYDPVEVGNEKTDKARRAVAQMVRSISPLLSIHDFRMVLGPTHTNYIFDVLAPMDYPQSDTELAKTVCASVQGTLENLSVVVQIDRSFITKSTDK